MYYNGAGHYIIGNDTVTVKAGNVVLYRPNQHQDYYYKALEKAELYWVHFTGYQAESLLRELDFGDNNFYHVGIHAEYIELFENIIHELQIKKPHYHQICISFLFQILSCFSRGAGFLENRDGRISRNSLENVIKAMNEEFQQEHAMDYYAQICNLSLFQFIRNFKKLTQLFTCQIY